MSEEDIVADIHANILQIFQIKIQ